MPRRRGLTYRKHATVSFKRLLESRIWLQDEYGTCDPTLQHTATEFKYRIVQERLSKLTTNQVEKFYVDGAWNVLLNKYDVDMSFKKMQKGELSDQASELKCFLLDNSATLLTTINNKITSILETELEHSMEDLLLTHVWFNLNRQHKSSIFSGGTTFVRSFKNTQLKLLNVQETLELCARSIWNALMYQAISYVIKNKIQEKITCTEEVVEADSQHETESMEVKQLADEQITLDKEEILHDLGLGANEIVTEATTAPQAYLRCKGPSKLFTRRRLKPNPLKKANHERKSPSKLFPRQRCKRNPLKKVNHERKSPSKVVSRQRSKPNPLKKTNHELCMKIPFPSDLTSTTEMKILLIQTVLKVHRLSASEVQLSWHSPKKYIDRIIAYEIFMLQGLKFNLDLSCWSKFNLEKIKELPTTFVISGLNSGSRYYFTMRSITDDEKVTPINDVQFIDL